MQIKFKNGSEIEIMPCNVSKRSSCSKFIYPIKFIQDFLPESWDKLYPHQKIMIWLINKIDTFKSAHFLPKEKITCLYCGKQFARIKANYIASRGNNKPMITFARIIRLGCCSDKCFRNLINAWNDDKEDIK